MQLPPQRPQQPILRPDRPAPIPRENISPPTGQDYSFAGRSAAASSHDGARFAAHLYPDRGAHGQGRSKGSPGKRGLAALEAIEKTTRPGDATIKIQRLLDGLNHNEITVENVLNNLESELSTLADRRVDHPRITRKGMGSDLAAPSRPQGPGPLRQHESTEDHASLRYLLSEERSRRLELEAQVKAMELHRRLSPRHKVSEVTYNALLKAFIGICGHTSALAASHKCLRYQLWQLILANASPIREADEKLDALVKYIEDAMEDAAISGDFTLDGCQSPERRWWDGRSPLKAPLHPPVIPPGGPKKISQSASVRPVGAAGQAPPGDPDDPLWRWWYGDVHSQNSEFRNEVNFDIPSSGDSHADVNMAERNRQSGRR
eukprot:GEMP01038131.1.p1 GENE.GEMP01038131.1~~GEMP01038131.1.p1  ORF type:complete len:396 (-),score=69.32 GEMP01038131.1:780-1907(-)